MKSDDRIASSEIVTGDDATHDSSLTTHNPIYDCWNTIGVEGNRTCRELVKYIHCRNCPVYSAAGLQLLDRPLSLEYRNERAAHYATAKTITQPARLSVVIFRLAHEWLALPTTVFVEVADSPSFHYGAANSSEPRRSAAEAGRRPLHTLPHRRRGLAMGLVNVRGELLICASLARLLGLEESKVQSPKSKVGEEGRVESGFRLQALDFRLTGRLLVAQWSGQRLAFPVSEVHGIQRFHKEELQDPPATIARSTLTYTRGVFSWRERTVGLLEGEAVFAAINSRLRIQN